MYLFILESIGTQELILVGMVALIVFGPRRLPGMAKKAGGYLRELRSVSDDFKSTWEEEVKRTENDLSLKNDDSKILPNDATQLLNNRIKAVSAEKQAGTTSERHNASPEIKELSQEEFEQRSKSSDAAKPTQSVSEAEKETWL